MAQPDRAGSARSKLRSRDGPAAAWCLSTIALRMTLRAAATSFLNDDGQGVGVSKKVPGEIKRKVERTNSPVSGRASFGRRTERRCDPERLELVPVRLILAELARHQEERLAVSARHGVKELQQPPCGLRQTGSLREPSGFGVAVAMK